MSELFESLKAGLESAINEPEKAVKHEISEVRRIRNKLNMTVREFSETFDLPKRTVEKWDMQDSGLTGAASTLMKVIENNPKAVMKALQE
ncbi:MAG: transcriptional regulator [Gammaproteobacteria bacterium]|nr:transcriptional regulator [Gammaproteobacteria bacterium]